MDGLGECPLCYGEVFASPTCSGFSVVCTSGCLQKAVKGATTREEAVENFKAFKLELEMGANMWGSKIQAGLGDD